MPQGEPSKKRPTKYTKPTAQRAPASLTSDIDSGDESDGKSALRNVEAREQPKAARRGPPNASMLHFRDPVPIVDRGGEKRWEFRCKYCTA